MYVLILQSVGSSIQVEAAGIEKDGILSHESNDGNRMRPEFKTVHAV